ncbi:MAG: CAAX amino terminal protease self- immunity [Verrucomicrobia bacterium ADurb.Bin345]|nr:MAG: CAAX amino terminal protease self- immunity [Verrucomicrobia bacterium ADurb.Bin345]
MSRRQTIVALLLLVPAPSIGTLAAMVLFPGSVLGKGLFAVSKLWLFAFPVVWLKFVERERFGFSPAKHGGFLAGLLCGIALSLPILLGYYAFGRHLFDPAFFAGKMREIGLGTLPAYLGGAAYWILVNSVLEEYVWRWFVYRNCERLLKPLAAVCLSALFFTLHHYIALQSYFSVPLALVCSLGVFLGGAAWSFMYMRYRSIWPGYISHAIVDLAVFGLGAALLFGSPQ